MIWLTLGLAGWFSLMTYRVISEGFPEEATKWSYVRGFLFSLLLGPLCFVFLGLLLWEWCSDG
jgi:hypothetical protein